MYRVYRRKKDGPWWIDVTVEGQRERRSARTTDRRLAEIEAAETERRIGRALVYGPEAVLTFGEAVESYLEAGGEPRFLAPIVTEWYGRLAAAIRPGDVDDLARRLYPDAKPATRNRQVRTPVAAVLNHAAERGLCPPIRLKRERTARVVKRAVGRDWIDRFMAAAPLHCAALALFMFQTGTRLSEALRLTWDDLDLEAGQAVCGHTKNGDPHVLNLTVEMVAILAALPRTRTSGRKSAPVVTTLRTVFGYASRSTARQAWERAIRRAGLPHVTRHEAGRHSFATALNDTGVDAKTIAELGNWSDAGFVLKHYAHPTRHHEAAEAAFGTLTARKGSKSLIRKTK